MRLFLLMLLRDIKIGLGRGSNIPVQLGFILIVASLFSFSIGAKQVLLQEISVGVILVSMLLGSLLSLPRLFEEDYEDGSLQLMWMQGLVPEFVVLAKVMAHILLNLIPLMVMVPVLGQLLYVPDLAVERLWLVVPVFAILIGLIGVIGGALTLGLRRSGVLLGVLVLPLYVPVVIFAVSAVLGESTVQLDAFMYMLAMVAIMLPLGVFLSTVALEFSINDN